LATGLTFAAAGSYFAQASKPETFYQFASHDFLWLLVVV
jgi:hypothetical protein